MPVSPILAQSARRPLFREAVALGAPKLLLGFPGTGHMLRDLTSGRVAETIDRFADMVGFDRYALYYGDYGPAPFAISASIDSIIPSRNRLMNGRGRAVVNWRGATNN